MKSKRKSRSRGIAETYIHIKTVPRSLSASEVNEYLNKYARSWAMDYFGSDVQVEIAVVEGSLKIRILVGGILLFNLVSNYGSFREGIDTIVDDARSFSEFVIEQFVHHEHVDQDEMYRLERRLGVPGKIQRFLRDMDGLNSPELSANGVPSGAYRGADRVCTIPYNAGSTTSVRSVDEIIPPMTTVASGRCTSEPMPVFRAIGTKPSEATSAVIRTGRSRVRAPSIIPSLTLMPWKMRSRKNATMTSPLRTAIPDSAMNPTAAEIENGIPRTSRAAMPPVNANGTPLKIIRASRNELRAMKSRPMISSRVTGTTMLSRFEADSRFLNVPP